MRNYPFFIPSRFQKQSGISKQAQIFYLDKQFQELLVIFFCSKPCAFLSVNYPIYFPYTTAISKSRLVFQSRPSLGEGLFEVRESLGNASDPKLAAFKTRHAARSMHLLPRTRPRCRPQGTFLPLKKSPLIFSTKCSTRTLKYKLEITAKLPSN